MPKDPRTAIVTEALARYRAGRISRRHLVGLMGALGLTAAATPLLLDRNVAAKNASGGHAGHMAGLAQEGAPEAAATPPLGEQADGSFTYKVVAGGGVMEEGIDVLAFFPAEVTVNAGDAIFWEVRGFHNVHFLRGAPLPPAIVPERAVGGVASPAASPAGGPPRLVLNPVVALPSGGTTYDGTAVVNSGPLDPSAPFVLTFTTPGEYDYYCSIHGEVMKGRVVVQDQGAARTEDQAAIDQRGTEEADAAIAEAQALIAAQGSGASSAAGGGREVLVGISGGQSEVNRFFPQELTIGVGETVRFVNPTTAPPVPHTVTFLSGGQAPELIVPEQAAGGPPLLVLSPEVMAPAGGSTYSGQGFVNSGLLLAEAGMTAYELTFDTPGTYRYYCAFHGSPEEGMIGDIVVE